MIPGTDEIFLERGMALSRIVRLTGAFFITKQIGGCDGADRCRYEPGYVNEEFSDRRCASGRWITVNAVETGRALNGIDRRRSEVRKRLLPMEQLIWREVS